MLTYGFEGAITIASAAASASSTPGAGARVALEADAVDLVAVAARDEPLLEREAARRASRSRCGAGRPSPAGSSASIPSARASLRGDGRERLACPQRLCPHEVEAEVAVAEPEPVLAAERGDGRERLPGLACPAPAPLLVVQAGERVEDAVEVGRDGEPEHLEVVADVADHGHVVRGSTASTSPRAKRAPPTPPERSATFTAWRQARRERRLRPRPRTQADPLAGRRACRRRRRGSGSPRRSRSRPAPRRGRGSGLHCRRRRGARTATRCGSASALVVPSAASTRPTAPSSAMPASVRRSCGTTQGRSALTTSTGAGVDALERGGDRRPLAAAGIVDHLGAELARERARLVVLRHEQRASSRDACREDVAEHRRAPALPERPRGRPTRCLPDAPR